MKRVSFFSIYIFKNMVTKLVKGQFNVNIMKMFEKKKSNIMFEKIRALLMRKIIGLLGQKCSA